MALCWPSLLLLIYAVSINADSTYTLTPEVTNFIPTCAQTCFISFLDSNFDTSTCGTTPTLDCLCSHNTTTGYTVGEGGVQCIISEDNIGFCKGNDAQSTLHSSSALHANTNCLQSLSSTMRLICVPDKQTLSQTPMPQLLRP